jgi:hypothetical protein
MAYGLRPVTHGGYQYNTGGFEEYPIDPGYTTQIFNGDIVRLTDDYGVIRSTVDEEPDPLILTAAGADSTVVLPANQALGVFVGCRYVDANGVPQHSQYYPAGSVTEAFAFVVTDPNAVFQIHSTDEWAEVDLGNNVNPVIVADATPGGSTYTGNSSTQVTSNNNVANGALRIIGVVRDGSSITAAADTCELLVRWSSPSCTIFGSPVSLTIA